VEVPIIIESPLTLEQPSQNLGESTGCSPIGIWFERFQALIGVFESITGPAVGPKIDLVNYLIDRLKRRQNNEGFRDEIRAWLSEKEKLSDFCCYCMFGPKHALGCLVGHCLFHDVEEEDIRKQKEYLGQLLKFLEGFRPSKNAILKQTIANKLLDTLVRFGLPRYFLKTSACWPLRIYFIPYEHKDFNGCYFPDLNAIGSFRPKS